MAWTGDGDQLHLPCSDEKVGMYAVVKHKEGGGHCDLSAEYKNKFILIGDCLSFNSNIHTNPDTSNMYFGVRFENDGIQSGNNIIRHVELVEEHNNRNAVHVLVFGLDDIRFNMKIQPSKIAADVLASLDDTVKRLMNRQIEFWCVTIPEIGDLDCEFRDFNNCLRKAAVDGTLKDVKLFDYSAAALNRPKSTAAERMHLLYSFFEQILGKSLMTDESKALFHILQNPRDYIVNAENRTAPAPPNPKPGPAVRKNPPSASQPSPPVQKPAKTINTGNKLADMLANMYLEEK